MKSNNKIPEEEYDEIEIADPYLLPDYIDNKYSVIDVKLYTKSKNYRHRFTFHDRKAKIDLSDLMEINTIELNKLPDAADGSPLYDWAKFIDAQTEEELSMIAERNPQVKEAVVKLRSLSADEQARWEYEMKEKIRMDTNMFEQWAREEGKQEEREKWQAVIADKDAEIARLREQLEKY
jgi:predicted transposase/invertase (TIGR01784 family)